MKTELSILIPTYNDDCYELVSELVRQAELIAGLRYEVIVSDDASSMTRVIISNRRIEQFPHCTFVENAVNRGRAGIRNALMQQAQYAWLLFIDAHRRIISESFLQKYLATDDDQQVVYGGYELRPQEDLRHNLRFLYEKDAAKKQAVEQRLLQPNHCFNTSNFLISRDLMQRHPLDQRFTRYGYEDVLFGKSLAQAGCTVHHINNPVGLCQFDDNDTFLQKTEEGLKTLSQFYDEFIGYSNIIDFSIRHPRISRFVGRLYKKKRKKWRKSLVEHPSLHTFTIYKLGYFVNQRQRISLRNRDQENTKESTATATPTDQ